MGDRCADERPKGDVVAVVVDRLAQGLKSEELVHVEDEARGVADEEELEWKAQICERQHFPYIRRRSPAR